MSENAGGQIDNVMQTARGQGMITMENAIEALVATGQITREGLE